MHVIPLAVIFHGADYEGRSNWGQVFNHLSLILAYLSVKIKGKNQTKADLIQILMQINVSREKLIKRIAHHIYSMQVNSCSE